MQLVSGRAQWDKGLVPPDFHPALTVICGHITHWSHLASLQVLSVTFSGCLLTDYQPSSPPPRADCEESRALKEPWPPNRLIPTKFTEMPHVT